MLRHRYETKSDYDAAYCEGFEEKKKRLHTEICCVLLLSTVRLTCLFLEVSEDHPFVIQALINKNRIEVGCTFFSP